MNILFHFVSLPHLDNDSSIFNSLIHEFKRNGHDVKVVTKDKTGESTRLVSENGIDVLRINCPDFTGVSSNVKKALAYIEYTLKVVKCTKKYFKKEKFDLIFSHSLPPELGFAVKKLKKYYGCLFYLEVPDFTWEDAVAFGYYSKNGLIGLYYRFWEKQMFKQADYIGIPTKGNISFIKKMYPWISDGKFEVFPFWQKPIELAQTESIKSKLGLDNKFVVIYGGSVGAAQRVDHMIELAETCRDKSDIVFLILGKGAYLDTLKQIVSDKGLENVIFYSFLPQKEYLSLLSSCDVGMIILNEKLGSPNFPSKTMSYMNLKVPILAAVDYVTDYGEYLDENRAGLWAYSDDVQMLKTQLLKYYESNELRKEIINNAYSLYCRTMTPEYAYKIIMKQINK